MSAIISQCILCHESFTTETMERIGKNEYCCQNCLTEIRESLKFYIDGKEVTREEYDKFIKGNNNE